jgi:hypothetical protein
VTDDDPLAGLDDVPWAQLWHSYGTADDVPGHLRAMQAGAAQEGRYAPVAQLANRIVHQGTRSQATVHTVPFLVRMALDPRLADRHRCVELLVAIAIGLDNNHLPNGYDPQEDRAYLESLRGEADDWARWIAEAVDEEQREQREGNCAQVLIDAEAVVRCYDAVSEALPALSALLASDNPELRAETANLLAWFPESAATSIPLLKAFVADEVSPGAAATAVVALGLLGEPATVPFVRRYLDSPDRRAALGRRVRVDPVRRRRPGRGRGPDADRGPAAGEDRDDDVPERLLPRPRGDGPGRDARSRDAPGGRCRAGRPGRLHGRRGLPRPVLHGAHTVPAGLPW